MPLTAAPAPAPAHLPCLESIFQRMCESAGSLPSMSRTPPPDTGEGDRKRRSGKVKVSILKSAKAKMIIQKQAAEGGSQRRVAREIARELLSDASRSNAVRHELRLLPKREGRATRAADKIVGQREQWAQIDEQQQSKRIAENRRRCKPPMTVYRPLPE